MLLYPGVNSQKDFKPYLNLENDQIEHECKLGFINVFDEQGKLDKELYRKVYSLIGL